ncbi:MAG TPA: alanine--tRNA ligase [Bacillota bacterium]|nr:alanine--tRNA ligase [Bacillota bacterium]HOH10596.1 alanine--tRNA ligase [Bacillota bacterium]HPI01964.1 alanine--tRNA ligase [Bacillota bacterium]HPM63645.1 alanine--tRNA ligase [Bacillota bacterium]
MKTSELRQAYMSFFEEKGHKRLPSASLIPTGDATLLLTAAGMVPFKPYFLGTAKPDYKRVTTCQKCVRTGDIDNVGRTSRHCTFFEMLGNFSFGDYFKEDAIRWAWEFVTERLKLDPQRLWITIYLDDDEAFRIWHEIIGLPSERIVRKGKEDNFWEIGVGPCGPCSEIHIDRGPSFGCGKPGCDINCGCDRFLEIWNLVFIQFFKDADGNYTPLDSKSIDTGMGLERTAAFLQGAASVYDTDEMMRIRDTVLELSGKTYGKDHQDDVGIRVVTDHSRAAVFMVADGILPTNEGRGYVLRRIIRRAVRYGRLIGIEEPFMVSMAEKVIDTMKVSYPELESDARRITKAIEQEERRFMAALEQGSQLLADMIGKLGGKRGAVLSGNDAFVLYDTFGFPYELTVEIAAEKGVKVDKDGFVAAMEAQRERARSARGANVYMDEGSAKYKGLSGKPTLFTGYGATSGKARLVGVLTETGESDEALPGEAAELVFDSTPFYAEGGGQTFDTGVVLDDGRIAARVVNVKKPLGDTFFHEVEPLERMEVGKEYVLKVDDARRDAVKRNHSATHLLHAALRSVLGDHVQQSGSYVTDERLRFDYSHFQPLKKEEVDKVETMVNRWIMADLEVGTKVCGIEQARESGAIALFDEKYGNDVRVVSMGKASKELCGGTHVGRTGEIGPFKIVMDGGIASGVRRIECLTGENTLKYMSAGLEMLDKVAEALKSDREGVLLRIEKMQAAIKESDRALAKVKQEQAFSNIDSLIESSETIDGSKLLVARFDGMDATDLRNLTDRIKSKLGSGVVLLGSVTGDKPVFIATVTPDLVDKGLKAGDLAREMAKVAGGGGGGKADMAQAGGKDPEKVDPALQAGKLEARKKLAGA